MTHLKKIPKISSKKKLWSRFEFSDTDSAQRPSFVSRHCFIKVPWLQCHHQIGVQCPGTQTSRWKMNRMLVPTLSNWWKHDELQHTLFSVVRVLQQCCAFIVETHKMHCENAWFAHRTVMKTAFWGFEHSIRKPSHCHPVARNPKKCLTHKTFHWPGHLAWGPVWKTLVQPLGKNVPLRHFKMFAQSEHKAMCPRAQSVPRAHFLPASRANVFKQSWRPDIKGQSACTINIGPHVHCSHQCTTFQSCENNLICQKFKSVSCQFKSQVSWGSTFQKSFSVIQIPHAKLVFDQHQ